LLDMFLFPVPCRPELFKRRPLGLPLNGGRLFFRPHVLQTVQRTLVSSGQRTPRKQPLEEGLNGRLRAPEKFWLSCGAPNEKAQCFPGKRVDVRPFCVRSTAPGPWPVMPDIHLRGTKPIATHLNSFVPARLWWSPPPPPSRFSFSSPLTTRCQGQNRGPSRQNFLSLSANSEVRYSYAAQPPSIVVGGGPPGGPQLKSMGGRCRRTWRGSNLVKPRSSYHNLEAQKGPTATTKSSKGPKRENGGSKPRSPVWGSLGTFLEEVIREKQSRPGPQPAFVPTPPCNRPGVRSKLFFRAVWPPSPKASHVSQKSFPPSSPLLPTGVSNGLFVDGRTLGGLGTSRPFPPFSEAAKKF